MHNITLYITGDNMTSQKEVITDILRVHGYTIKTHQLQIKDLLSIFALPIKLNKGGI